MGKKESVKTASTDIGIRLEDVAPSWALELVDAGFYAPALQDACKARIDYRMIFIDSLLATMPLSLEAGKYAIVRQAREAGVSEAMIMENMDSLRRTVEEYAAVLMATTGVSHEEAVKQVQSWGKTAFYRNHKNQLCMMAYQLRGGLKENGKWLNANKCTSVCALSGGYKKLISGDVHIYGEDADGYIPIKRLDGQDLTITDCVRPVVRDNPQFGDSAVALAISEAVPEKSYLDFYVIINNRVEIADAIKEMLIYGVFNGLGAWRTSGKGRYVVKAMNVTEVPK